MKGYGGINMETISENLTNLKNARVAIINKLNKVQGSSIPLTTTLAELPKYIEGGTMGIVDFDTWKVIMTNSRMDLSPSTAMEP